MNNINKFPDIPKNIFIRDIKKKMFYTLNWLISNFLSLAIPIMAILLSEAFKKCDSQFDLRKNYEEVLMVSISISLNLIVQLSSKEYNISENVLVFIKTALATILVLVSLAFGIANILGDAICLNNIIFFSSIMFSFVLVIGLGCGLKKKVRD